MNKKIVFGLLIAVAFSVCSCSVTTGTLGNSTQSQIVLKGNNFKVLESVTGQASSEYWFLIGTSKQNLTDRARRDMIEKANMAGSSKAIINVTVDMESKFFLFWSKKTVYVSGDVILFTDK